MFEDYLKVIHAHNYHGTHDDMSDAFELWITKIDTDIWLMLGDAFAKRCVDGTLKSHIQNKTL